MSTLVVLLIEMSFQGVLFRGAPLYYLDSIEVVHGQYSASLVLVCQETEPFCFASLFIPHKINVNNLSISIRVRNTPNQIQGKKVTTLRTTME